MPKTGLPGRPALLAWAGCVLLCACPNDKQPPPPPTPPQVFLTNPASSSNVISTQLQLKASVSGCKSVKQLQLLQAGSFIQSVDMPAKATIDLTVPPSAFNSYYNKVGIAAALNLSAKAICDDDRSNTSTGLGVSWFPVASVLEPMAGAITTMPDAFVAEGGIGTPTTFIGCIGTATGYAVARVDTGGNVVGANTTLPFNCSAAATVTDKNNATGGRWLMEPAVGAFSVDGQLNINGFKSGSFVQIGVGPEGDALVYSNKSMGGYSLFRIGFAGGGENAVWSATAGGLLLTSPIINQGNGEAYVLTWNYQIDQYSGAIQVERYNWQNGALVGTNPLGTQSYGYLNVPVLPGAAFSKDGSSVFFAVQQVGSTGRTTSQVVACASLVTGCSPPSGTKWASPTLDAVITAVVPYQNDKIIAAIAPDRVYFLDGTNGSLISYMMNPLIATGGLGVLQVQPGVGREFYVLNGPSGGWPTEVIATDDPTQGELWRFNIEGGNTPQTGITMSVDEAGQSWLRVGVNQVKPLALTDYRNVRGTSP